MPRKSKIQYNPKHSVAQNARDNGVSEDAVRHYIKRHGIDRSHERKVNIVNEIRTYLSRHPQATKEEVSRKTKHSVSTIRKYWGVAKGAEELPIEIGRNKVPKVSIREINNYYATHPSCTYDILREEDFNREILEPFCGGGSMAEVIRLHGYEVRASDIVDRGYGEVADFFSLNAEEGRYDIISNPPYCEALNEIIPRCIRLCKNKVALLLPLRYLSGRTRHKDVYVGFPPARVYVYVERIAIAKNAEFDKYDAGSNMEIYAWYVWEKGYKGTPELRWIHNESKAEERALVMDFDRTLFDTSVDDYVRKVVKGKDIVWNDVYSLIPDYRLYGGWREVFAWCKRQGIRTAIVSTAKTELIKRTLAHFDIHCDAIVGWQLYHRKPSPKLIELALSKLNVRQENALYIGDSTIDMQMSANCEIRFVGAVWDSEEAEALKKCCTVIDNPKDIVNYLKEL